MREMLHPDFELCLKDRCVRMYPESSGPDNPFESPEEALAYIQAHGDDSECYCWSTYDGVMREHHCTAYVDWALDLVRAEDLDSILASFDANIYPRPLFRHLASHVDRCSTDAIKAWLEHYPKSSYCTGQRPRLPHTEAGQERSYLAKTCIEVLHHRGVDVRSYTHPCYATPIREQAYLCLHLPYRSCRQAYNGEK